MLDSVRMVRNLSAPAIEKLEALVDQLESGWHRGCAPRVEDLLSEAASLSPADREVVLRELVLTDVEFRLRGGAPASAASIVRRPFNSEMPARPGRLGKFDLRELAGSGSFGEVYRARDTQLGRDVALKIPRRDRLATENDGELFLREARHAARLRHPGIVPVYEAGETDGVYYLACAFVPGGTLRSRLREGALPFHQSAEIVAQVAEALDYAHREGVVHRDVKPANILFDAEGRPCIADFGLAQAAAPDATLTMPGARVGTPAFMSPEQLAGDSRRVDARSDVYSLGVVLYELLTGQLPFLGRGRVLEIEVLCDEPRPPRRLDEHVPLDLESICLKAMAKEPAGRYATAGEMADDLRRYLAGEPIRARPIGRCRRATRWCRRRPALAALATALAAAVVMGFGGIAWQWRRAEAHRELSRQNVRQAHAAIRQLNEVVAEVVAEAGRKDDPESRPLRRKLLERSVEYYREFLKQLPEDADLRNDVAHSLWDIAFAAYGAGDKEQAREALVQALPLWEHLAGERPDDRETLYFLAKDYYMLGLIHARAGLQVEARAWYEKSLAVRQRLVRLFPQDDSMFHDLVEVQASLAYVMSSLGEPDKGLNRMRVAVEQRRRLVERHPGHQEYGRRLADLLSRLAEMLRVQGRLDEAEFSCREAVAVAGGEVAANRGMPYSATTQAQAQIVLARVLHDEGDVPTARQTCRQALEALKSLARMYPSYARLRELRVDAEAELRKIDPLGATASTAPQ